MFVESLLEESNPEYITLQVVIEEGQFLQYLSSRIQHYPSFIQSNTSWITIKNPYKPFISPFPEQENHSLITLNEPTTIKLPSNFIGIFRNRYKAALISCLLKWIQDEHEMYQSDWHSKANPLASSLETEWCES